MKTEPHPDTPLFRQRLADFGKRLETPLESTLFRFINPRFSKSLQIVDGTGSLRAAGRWNLPGPLRLSYTALEPQTALSEALAHVAYYRLPIATALPRVLVALNLRVARALDLRDGNNRRLLQLSASTIKNLDWRSENLNGRETVTQAWGRVLGEAGYEAVVTPSAAHPKGACALVFTGNLGAESSFEVESEIKWP